MILAFSDHTMNHLDSVSLHHKRKLRRHKESILHVSFTPDDRMLASVSHSELRLWNSANEACRYLIKSEGYEEIKGCTWAPDSNTIALHLSSGRVHAWDVALMTLRHKSTAELVTFSQSTSRPTETSSRFSQKTTPYPSGMWQVRQRCAKELWKRLLE